MRDMAFTEVDGIFKAGTVSGDYLRPHMEIETSKVKPSSANTSFYLSLCATLL